MSDVKRVTLTTISDVVKKGGGGGGGGAAAASPFSSLSAFESTAANLNPFGKGGEGSSGGGANGSGGGGGGATKKLKTVRLELNLFEPTADSFPEFNFSKLVHVEQKRLKKAQKKSHDDEANGFLTDPELDNDVARMARELERKYGSGSDYASKGKSARPSKLDYYDRGAGYDEEDSFIDNSEAYDELIPQEIETVGGGFYINSGQLEFKQLSNFERPEDAHRMPKPKKRALSTTSESSEDDEPANDKKKVTETGGAVTVQQKAASVEKPSVVVESQQNRPPEQAAGKTVPASTVTGGVEDEKSRMNGHVAKKQKLVDNGLAVANEQKNKSSTSDGKEKTNGVKEKPPAMPAVTAAGGDGSGKKEESDGAKAIKTTTVKDMLRAKRDSLRKMEQEKKGRSSGSSRVSSSEAEEDGDGGGDDEDEDEENDEEDDDEEDEDEEYDVEEGGSEKNSHESGSDVDIASESESSHGSEKDATVVKGNPPVPPATSNVLAVANGMAVGGGGGTALATAGEQQSVKERKPKDCKLPDGIPDRLRQDVESLKELARAISGTGKLNFFESKTAELLLRIDEGARASSLSSSIRNATFRHLEAQLSISRQSLQLKVKKVRIRKLENKTKSLLSKMEDVIADTMPAIITKYELDCLKVNELRLAQATSSAPQPPLPNGEKGGDGPPATNHPQIRNPKKKYTWNERSRDLLWELYNVRMQLFGMVRPRNQTEEEVIAEFIRAKVVPLWPKSWMRYEDVQKELDRRKKALAKAQLASIGASLSVGKKSTVVVVSPMVSPVPPYDAGPLLAGTAAASNGLKAHDTARPPRTSTPSSGKSMDGKGGGGVDPEKTAPSTHHALSGQPGPAVTANHMSPNSSHKRTSDHSIINIMNSPPPPAASTERQSGTSNCSLTAIDGRDDSKRSPAATAAQTIVLSPADRKSTSSDRQRWNNREDDSDSSIEIIAEYNVPKTAGSASFQPGGAGKLPAGSTSVLHMAISPQKPLSGSNLPVLNKEKYKNLVAGKHKPHSHGGSGGSSAGSSPIAMSDMSAMVGGGKYVKQSPSSSGGVIGFAAPSGNVSGSSARSKDNPSPIDVDVHQIMKDLKELQELQKQQNTSGSRMSDSSSLQSQQPQHEAATTSAATTATTSSTVADYFIDCDMDEEDILFATNFTYSGGHSKS